MATTATTATKPAEVKVDDLTRLMTAAKAADVLTVTFDAFGHIGWKVPPTGMADAYLIPMAQIRDWCTRYNALVDRVRAAEGADVRAWGLAFPADLRGI